MKITRFLGLILFLVFACSLYSCDDDTIDPPVVTPNVFSNGYFIINEGNFQSGNGSISFVGEDTVVENTFQRFIGRPLGDVVQDMQVINDQAYIVVNNDNKMEVVTLTDSSLVEVTTITDLHLPRRIIQVSDSKAYLSNWGAFDGSIPAYLAIIDLATNTISDTITIGSFAGSDVMAISGSRVFVANDFNSTVSIVNTITDEVVGTIQVAESPASMVVEGNSLWLLCSGGYGADFGTIDDDTPAVLTQIDLSTEAVVSTNNVGIIGDHPSQMILNNGSLIIANAGALYQVSTSQPAWPSNTFADSVSAYGMGGTSTGNILVGDALGFTGPGEVKTFDASGTLLSTSSSYGVGPNGFAWVD